MVPHQATPSGGHSHESPSPGWGRALRSPSSPTLNRNPGAQGARPSLRSPGSRRSPLRGLPSSEGGFHHRGGAGVGGGRGRIVLSAPRRVAPSGPGVLQGATPWSEASAHGVSGDVGYPPNLYGNTDQANRHGGIGGERRPLSLTLVWPGEETGEVQNPRVPGRGRGGRFAGLAGRR